MWNGWVTLGAALLGWIVVSCSPQDRAALAELRARLDLPASGVFVVERKTVDEAVPREDHAEALAYARRVTIECNEGRGMLGEFLVENARGPRFITPLLSGVQAERVVFEQTETLAFDAGSWRVTIEETTSDGRRLVSHRIRDAAREIPELVLWLDTERRNVTRRLPDGEPIMMGWGSVLEHARFVGSVRGLLDAAADAGVLQVRDDGVSLELDLKTVDFQRYFAGSEPRGVSTVPGLARLEYTPGPAATVSMTWADCLGSPIVSRTIEWQPDSAFPSALMEDLYLPGSDRLVRRSVATIRPASADIPHALAHWVPLPGEDVIDSRFGAAVRYRVRDDGNPPDDDEILIMSEERQLGLGDEPPPMPIPAGWSPGDGSATGEEGAIHVSDDVVDLGPVPLGTVHEVGFRLTNTSDELVHFGPPELDCGCIHPRFDLTRLDPGETTLFIVEQHISELGPQEVSVRLAHDGAGSPLELRIVYQGTPAPGLRPHRLHVGTLTASSPPQAVTLELDDGGCATDEPPQLSWEGELDVDWSVNAITAGGEEEDAARGERDESEPESAPGGADTPVPVHHWIVEGTCSLPPDAPLGVVGGELSINVPGCDRIAGRVTARVYAAAAPPELADRWPSCRLALAGSGRIQRVLVLPETRIRSWAWVELPDVEIAVTTEPRDGGDAIAFAIPYRIGVEWPTHGALVELDTDRGAVRVELLVAARVF